MYADGSVKQTGETGCACTVPEHGVTRGQQLNTGVSIFTAELQRAIYMASEFVKNSPDPPPSKVVIRSDSKGVGGGGAALQAMARGGTTRNRENLQAKVLLNFHEIIKKGTSLILMWLPSHTLVSKVMTQPTGKPTVATRHGTPCDLGLSYREIRRIIYKAALANRATSMKNKYPWMAIPTGRLQPPTTQFTATKLEDVFWPILMP